MLLPFSSRAMRQTCSRVLFLSALASGIAVSPVAEAQDDPRKAQSTPVFEEGLKLADRGKHAEALEKFRQSYALYPSPNTLFNIARTEQLLGKKVDALRDYREALKNPILNPQMVERGKRFIADLEKTTSRVDVTGPTGAKVTVNGVDYMLPLSGPIDVEPGPVVARSEQDGKSVARSGQAQAGTVLTLDVTPKAAEAPITESKTADAKASTSVFTEPPAAGEDRGFWTTRHTLGVISAGLAVAGAAVGTGFLVAREGHVSDAQDVVRTNPNACAQPSSPACASYDDAKSSANSAGTGALISYIAAGAFGVGAVVLLWPSGSSSSTTTGQAGRVRVTPMGTGLSLSGSF